MDGLSAICLGIAILAQLAAAFMAWRLVRITETNVAWICISIALILMVVRRTLTLASFPVFGTAAGLEVLAETVALATSILMMVGISRIRPIFEAFRGSNEQLRQEMAERELAQAAVGKSERKYRSLFDYSRDAIAVVTKEGHLVEANRAFSELFGYELPEMVSTNVGQLWVDPEELLEFQEALNRGECLVDYPFRARRKDGIERDCLITSSVWRSGQGETLYQAICRDVTERTIIERALRESEERYRDLYENASDALYTHDVAGKYTSANKAAERIIGYPRDLLLSMNFRDVVHQDDLSAVEENFRNKIQYGLEETGPYEVRVRRQDGSVRWVEVTSRIVGEQDKAVAVQGSARDVTERKLAEEALRRSEQKLRDVVELLPEPVLETNGDGGIVFLSQKAFEVFGYSQEDLDAGLNAAQLIAPVQRHEAEANIKRILQGEYIGVNQYSVIRKDGTQFPGLVHSAPILLQDGVAGLRGIIVDVSEQEHARETLREQKEFLTNVLESLTHPFYVINARDYTITIANSAAVSAGLSSGATCYAATHRTSEPCAGMHWLCPLDEVKRTGSPIWLEHEHYDPKGNKRIFEVHAYPLFDESGTISQVIEYCLDVTDRKAAEKKYQESEKTFQEFANEVSFEGIIIHDKGTILYVNEIFAKMYGYEPYELLATRTSDTIAPTYRQLVEQMITEGSEQAYEAMGQRRDGSTFPVEIHGREVSFGDRVVRVAAVKDLTDRKKAEDTLRESEERFRSLFEAANELIEILDAEGRIVAANPALLKGLGYSQDSLVGRHITGFMTADSAPLFTENLPKLREHGICTAEVELVAKDGTILPVQCSASTIRHEDGSIKHFVLMQRDITEHRRLEEQLRQAVKMEAIGRLAGGVAHDFNNLLTAIMGYTNILMRQLPMDENVWQKLSQISRASQRAAGLTQQLLAFGRRQLLDMKVLDVNAAVSDLEDMLQRLMGEDIYLLSILDPQLGRIRADQGQIEQIIVNLVVNARDAMPRGGTLTVETTNVTLEESYAKAHPEIQEGDYVLLSISDNGVGMASETCSRIFDPFFTTKAKGLGTGLGLSTVYGIVKQHGGHITVYSEPGIGTTFKVYFPLVEGTVESSQRPKALAPSLHGTETVLVVEDEPLVRNLAVEILEMLGYTATGVGDPEEAIAFSDSRKDEIHLLLTDVVLPRMDGRSLAHRLLQSRPNMRVLFISGYTENAIVHHGVLDPDVQFLQKPFTVDSLVRKVRETLDQAAGPVRGGSNSP